MASTHVCSWLPAPGEPGAPADLQNYGEELARRISTGSPLDLLVGLSVGAQAAAVAATAVPTGQVRHVMLISPTVDPNVRTGHPSRPHARSAN